MFACQVQVKFYEMYFKRLEVSSYVFMTFYFKGLHVSNFVFSTAVRKACFRKL